LKHVTPEAAIKTAHKTKTEMLAEAILADRERATTKRRDIVDCIACGHSFKTHGSDTCSARCSQWLADGNPPHDLKPLATVNDVPMEQWRVVKGPPGCIKVSEPNAFSPFAAVRDQIIDRQRSGRRTLGHDADHKRLKAFMVAADVPFKCEVDYLPKGWRSVLRRPAWAPTATPSEFSDWRISGEWGSVFVDGEDGYHLSVETRIEGTGSFMTDAPTWDDVQRRLHFCRAGGEGCLYLKGLPTPKQAVAICAVLGIPRNRDTGNGKKATVAEAA